MESLLLPCVFLLLHCPVATRLVSRPLHEPMQACGQDCRALVLACATQPGEVELRNRFSCPDDRARDAIHAFAGPASYNAVL